ncbi:unnamed protein product [Linum tenue]|uniref:Uncharacterized protein n=1 Tax=Linum tenue TaxID=586396 RepID=A0AAV0JMC6_9ROSI|nr:unnamed protein product [Linum tenue]
MYSNRSQDEQSPACSRNSPEFFTFLIPSNSSSSSSIAYVESSVTEERMKAEFCKRAESRGLLEYTPDLILPDQWMIIDHTGVCCSSVSTDVAFACSVQQVTQCRSCRR